MNRMRRAIGILPPLVLVLAACAAPGTGGGDDSSDMATTSAAASASTASSGATGRVDIGDLYADPAAFAGQEVTILGRVDGLVGDRGAFLTSPSGEDEGLLVVPADDATVEKEAAQNRVLWITGIVVPFDSEALAAAWTSVGVDDPALAEYTGDYAVVATELGDPLAG
jgi:hypothetical protein